MFLLASLHAYLFARPRAAPPLILFPYTTLFRSHLVTFPDKSGTVAFLDDIPSIPSIPSIPEGTQKVGLGSTLDRKSTRLNSSHVATSYAAFCMKQLKVHLQLTIYESEYRK